LVDRSTVHTVGGATEKARLPKSVRVAELVIVSLSTDLSKREDVTGCRRDDIGKPWSLGSGHKI